MTSRALFVGVDDYAFSALLSCVNDAVAMLDTLVALNVFLKSECT